MAVVGKKPIGPMLGDDRALRHGKSLRAKVALHITSTKAAFQQYFVPVPNEQRHMEDGSPPSTWAQYREAILRPRRWIDGIGILGA
eukprot:6988335-Alexandrium_andersonii.AAC.1